MGKPRILLISHEYAPKDSPNSRILRLLFSKLTSDYDLDIITKQVNGKRSEKTREMEIFRVPSIKEKIKNLLKISRKGALLGNNGPSVDVKKTNLINKILPLFFWPDYTFLWIWPALQIAKRLLSTRNYRAVVSISHPFSNHIVALSIKKKNPGLQWMMYMNDPFTLSTQLPVNNTLLFNGLNGIIERGAIKRADKHIVSFEMSKYYKTTNKTYALKLPVVEELSLQTEYDPSPLKKKKIVFLGALYKNIRDPTYFLEIASILINEGLIEVGIYGDIGDCSRIINAYKQKCGDGLQIHGFVTKETADLAARQADVLVNLSNRIDIQIPSKLFEYMALSKPIINIVYNRDTTARYIDDYRRGISIKIGDPAGSEKLKYFLHNFIPDANQKTIEEHLVSFGVKKIREIMEL
jgi:glycosyltransferase involved in cell wall biosynthesis